MREELAIARLVPRNQMQNADVESVKIGRVTVAATGLYTVPAGKVALVISITGVLDAVGADATYAVAILRSGTFRPVGAFVNVGVGQVSEFNGKMLLIAGDIITNVGDAGSTNGTIDMSASVREYNA